ncbi:MAG: c-type cytochrome [Sulfurospirillaceae bacterium]|nr:c-type cytochrome [Sulfurospirillaceae bacterium]
MFKKIVYACLALGILTSFAQARQYSVAEIYDQMCSKCHGAKGEGNPEKKGPVLNDLSKEELSYELFEIIGRSTDGGHEIMEHNQKKIVEKGMDYHPEDMAMYIYSSFNKTGASKIFRNSGQASFGERRVYSTSEIYKRMCSKCHGINAEGVPEKKGPSLNEMSYGELEMELYSLQSLGGGFQSSGTEHEVMEHNQKKIVEKGMDYHPEDMATYIYHNFNKTKPKAKK